MSKEMFCPLCNTWVKEPSVNTPGPEWVRFQTGYCPKCRARLQENQLPTVLTNDANIKLKTVAKTTLQNTVKERKGITSRLISGNKHPSPKSSKIWGILILLVIYISIPALCYLFWRFYPIDVYAVVGWAVPILLFYSLGTTYKTYHCSRCHATVDRNTKVCPKCGVLLSDRDIAEQERLNKRRRIVVGRTFVPFMGLVLFIFLKFPSMLSNSFWFQKITELSPSEISHIQFSIDAFINDTDGVLIVCLIGIVVISLGVAIIWSLALADFYINLKKSA